MVHVPARRTRRPRGLQVAAPRGGLPRRRAHGHRRAGGAPASTSAPTGRCGSTTTPWGSAPSSGTGSSASAASATRSSSTPRGRARRARTPSRSTSRAASPSAGRSSAARSASPSSTRSPSAVANRPDQGVRRRRSAAAVDHGALRGRARSRTASTCRPRWPTSSAPRSRTSSPRAASHVQLEDLGAWVPNVTRADRDFEWVTSTVDRLFAGIEGVERCWHFCLGNAWGSRAEGLTRGGYGNVLPHYFDVDVDAFVLDFACRDMADVGVLARPAGRQARARGRHRRAQPRGRAARAGRRAHPRGARGRRRRARDAHHRLRHEAAAAHRRAREAALARRRARRSCAASSPASDEPRPRRLGAGRDAAAELAAGALHALAGATSTGARSPATRSCGRGRSTTSRASGPRSGATSTSARRPYEAVLGDRAMPGARWFAGARLNYAEHALRSGRGDRDRRGRARRGRAARRADAGTSCARRSAAWPAGCASAASAAATSWPATCPTAPRPSSPTWPAPASARSGRRARPTSQPAGALDRFAQLRPAALIACDGYRYGGRAHDRRAAVAEIAGALETLRTPVVIVRPPRPRAARRAPSRGRPSPASPAAPVFEAAPLRPPALRALLLGDHRPAEGDRPRPRRPAARPHPPSRAAPRPRPGGPLLLLHGHRAG